MIKTFNQLKTKLTLREPIGLAVVQPKKFMVIDSVKIAQDNGWVDPYYFEDENDVNATQQAIQAIHSGQCSLIMKGDISTTTLLKGILSSTGIPVMNRLSHVAVMESPAYEKLMLWTDGGVNIELTQDVLISMIQNAISLSKSLGNTHPQIALLTLVEKLMNQLPETLMAHELKNIFTHEDGITIEGPIALDVALSSTSAERKGIASSIAGETDIFVGPSITATNHIVKALIALGNAEVGGIIMGASIPIILLSRSDDKSTRLNSMALGAFLSGG